MESDLLFRAKSSDYTAAPTHLTRELQHQYGAPPPSYEEAQMQQRCSDFKSAKSNDYIAQPSAPPLQFNPAFATNDSHAPSYHQRSNNPAYHDGRSRHFSNDNSHGNQGNRFSHSYYSDLQIKKSNLATEVYFKSFLMFAASFAIAFGISKIRPFKSATNNFQLLAAFCILASVWYLILYPWQLTKIEESTKQKKKYNNTNALAIAMPILLGVMIAPVFLKFQTKEVFAAIIGAVAIGGTSCLYGVITKKDLSKPVHFLANFAIALIIVSLINVFILKNNFIEIGISAFFILFHGAVLAYNSGKMNKEAENINPELETQFTNSYAMQTNNSLVGITLELLNIKQNASEIGQRG